MTERRSPRRLDARRRWLWAGALGVLLTALFVGIIYSGARTWWAYNETFGASSASKGWLQREGASYSVDVYDELLAVRRLEIYCLRFAGKSMSKGQFNLLRRQVVGSMLNFAPDSVLAQAVSAHASFPEAYSSMQAFLKAAEGLENGQVTIDEVTTRGEAAGQAWGRLTVDSNDAEFAARDGMGRAIVEFRPLALRAFSIGAVLLTLLALATVAAGYAAWRAWKAERRRFDRFEVLLATVGHDLRSPLQALVGAAKLAAADTVVSEREKFVRIVHERSAYFTRLLDDLVNLARSESMAFLPAPVNLAAWFEAAASRYRVAVESKHLTFGSRLAADHPFVAFDSHRLTQCADNLVFNAVRYTEKGTVTFAVRFELGEELASGEGKLTIEVTDTGRGIAPGDRERIFEPFVRVDSAVRGMGIGLSMVASLARRIGGSIAVKSFLGQGSTFTFTAPVMVAPPPQPAAPAESVTARVVKASSPGTISAAVPRVLVVDDDPHITQVVGGLLPHMGFAADVAIGGRAGLERAKSNVYCAVLTDLQMPELDGFELASAIRSSADPCPMLIAMTAYTAKPSADHRAASFDAMLRKPFDEDELVELLDRAATRWAELAS